MKIFFYGMEICLWLAILIGFLLLELQVTDSDAAIREN